MILRPKEREGLRKCAPAEVVGYLAVKYYFLTANQPTKRMDLAREILKVTAYQMNYKITSHGILREIRLMYERGELKFDDTERTFTLANYPAK